MGFLLSINPQPAEGQVYYSGRYTLQPGSRPVGSSAVAYYRGADGRLYGMPIHSPVTRRPAPNSVRPVVPQQLGIPTANYTYSNPSSQRSAVPPTNAARRATEIVIEDATPATTYQVGQNVVPVQSQPMTRTTQSDPATRQQAEQALRRFQETQGVAVAQNTKAETNPVSAVTAEPELPAELPAPKEY